MKAIKVKHVYPIMNFDSIIYFGVVGFCFNADQYFFVTIFQKFPRQMFRLDLPSITPILLLWDCFLGNPQNIPYMDMLILDTYLNPDYKSDDSDTHHNHNQLYKH